MTGWGFPRPSLLFMRVMRGLWLWVACVCGSGVARRFESFALRCRLWGFGGLCVVSAGCVVYVSSFVVGVVVFCLLSCWFQAIIYPINWFINVIECPTDPGFE